MFRFSSRSYKNMVGVRPELVAVTSLALARSSIDFAVTEGLRSEARQRELVRSGASQTLRSRHLTGHAVDLAAWVDGGIRWDWPLYERLSEAMLGAAGDLGVGLEWGGHWQSLKDGPHFQLPWAQYP